MSMKRHTCLHPGDHIGPCDLPFLEDPEAEARTIQAEQTIEHRIRKLAQGPMIFLPGEKGSIVSANTMQRNMREANEVWIVEALGLIQELARLTNKRGRYEN